MRLVSVNVDEKVYKDLHALASKTGVSFSEHIRHALGCYPPFKGFELSGAEVRMFSVSTTSGKVVEGWPW